MHFIFGYGFSYHKMSLKGIGFIFLRWVSVVNVPNELTFQFLAFMEIYMASWFSHCAPFCFFPRAS